MEPAKPFPIYQLMDAFEAFTTGEADVKPQHRSLYYFLVGYARRRGNVVRFNMPYENGLHGSGIGSWATYDAALKALQEWGFIVYTPGANRFKTPVIELTFRNPTDDVLLTYWQSYCISTGDNKRPIDLESNDDKGASRIAELEKEVADLKAKLPKPKPVPAGPQISDDLKTRLAGLTDTSGELRWSESILTKPDYFATVVAKLGHAGIDVAHYRRAALVVAEADDVHRTLTGWESWVSIYFTNQLRRGPLLALVAATLDLSRPTPREELPPVGTDCTGRHIVLPNTSDANMNRMVAANYARDFPNATIHHTR